MGQGNVFPKDLLGEKKRKKYLDFVYKKFLWLRKKGNITRKYEYHDEADLIVLKVQVASQL